MIITKKTPFINYSQCLNRFKYYTWWFDHIIALLNLFLFQNINFNNCIAIAIKLVIWPFNNQLTSSINKKILNF